MNTLQINAARSKKNFVAFMLTYFHLTKGSVTSLRLETIIANFFHSNVFVCKVFINQFFKTQACGACGAPSSINIDFQTHISMHPVIIACIYI